MSRREQLGQQMGAALARQPAAGDDEQPRRPREARPPRTEPVRITLDLEPALHKRVKHFAVDHEAHLADVFRILGRRLLEDKELAAHVVEQLDELER